MEEGIKEYNCIKEISDMILQEMCSTEVRIHRDELKLEMPKINAVEIFEMPNETKLEMSIIKETCLGQGE